jgi:uncharacterized membrane protein YdjX (TVP38/TMEM64 family)
MRPGQIGLLAACSIAALVTAGLLSGVLGLSPPVDMGWVRALQAELASAYAGHPAAVSLGYFVLFTLLAALCLPGALLLLLAGGATFGLVWGSLLATLASTCGATLTLLAARQLLRPWVEHHHARRRDDFLRALADDAGVYLLSLRLLPVIPFAMVNLLAGVTQVPVRTFFWTAFVGMLPGTVAYVNVGRELAQLQSLSGLLEPGVIIALAALGLLPLCARWVLGRPGRPAG